MTHQLHLKRFPHEQPDLQHMDAQVHRLRRQVLNQHLWTEEGRAGWLKEILDFQAADGSFGLVDSPRIESDCRVAYYYEPSYLCSALLMREALSTDKPAQEVLDALKRGLAFCCGRRLQGHGFDAAEGEERAMGWLITCGLTDFLLFYPDLVPEFTELTTALLYNWTRVFVYGSLMSTGIRHQALGMAVYLGRGHIEGYTLYDLGPYPAARQGGHGKILGECYFVHRQTLRLLDQIEGQGVLFRRYPAWVTGEGFRLYGDVYLYADEVHGARIIREEEQPYGPRQEDLVWYAAYGSNTDEKRFLYYIRGGTYPGNGKQYTGCRDKTPPIASMPVQLHYERYFAKRSPGWDMKGVAFLDMDRPGVTRGRAYLITREQYQDIRNQEGPNWYNEDALLGTYHGIPVRTLSHISRISPENEPADDYLRVVKQAARDLGGYDNPVF